MRRTIVNDGAVHLRYEIREIVALAHEIAALGKPITWENIGDPIQKGERAPRWIVDTVHDVVDDPASWAYVHSLGAPATREFLAAKVNDRPGGVRIGADDILFFNGTADAMDTVYGLLGNDARILVPSPAYITHRSLEAAHAPGEQPTYQLDPTNGWLPDVDEIRSQCRQSDAIVGILVLSPDNPTGSVVPRDVLEQIAEVAREFGLFLISDEIYAHIVFGGRPRLHLSEWIGDVPGLAMRGISKEYPWPGARCGWMEVLNRGKDSAFAEYVAAIEAAKQLEVSATVLPQMTIPKVFGDPRYEAHLARRARMFERRADEVVAIFAGCESVILNKPSGAFFFTVVFKPGVVNERQTLSIEDAAIRAHVERRGSGVPCDRRFVYYLMGATGIVVVPLGGFGCRHDGFRATLLEMNDDRRAWTFKSLRESIDRYVDST